jgi:hypothetical protein
MEPPLTEAQTREIEKMILLLINNSMELGSSANDLRERIFPLLTRYQNSPFLSIAFVQQIKELTDAMMRKLNETKAKIAFIQSWKKK